MKIVTHNGKFHTDDVMAVALLTTLFPDATVVRTRNEEEMRDADIVLDVGAVYDVKAGRFDHHQDGRAGARENGIMYSALGLIWKEYGLQFCNNDEEVWQRIDEGFVASIDAIDNGQELYKLTDFDVKPIIINDIISLYMPTEESGSDFDTQFFEVVEFAKVLFSKKVAATTERVKLEREFREAYKNSPNKNAVVLDKYMPFSRVAEDIPELLYVAFPNTSNDAWMLQAVGLAKDSFGQRKPLPIGWTGKRDADLVAITGIKDATFCHNARHLAGAKTKEGIEKMLQLALDSEMK